MEKIKSLADLKKIKDNVQAKIELREKSEHPESRIQIKVAMATCGIAAGSKATMTYFFADKCFAVFLAEPAADLLAVCTTATMFFFHFRRTMAALEEPAAG